MQEPQPVRAAFEPGLDNGAAVRARTLRNSQVAAADRRCKRICI